MPIRSISATRSYRRPYFPGVFRKLFRVSFDGRAVSGKIPGGFILKTNKEINHAGQPICSGFRKVSGTKRREMVLRWIADGRRAVRMNSDGRNRAMGDLGPVGLNRLCAHVVRDGTQTGMGCCMGVSGRRRVSKRRTTIGSVANIRVVSILSNS